MTRLPASAISVAATRPASPPPITMTSASSAIGLSPCLVKGLKPAASTTVNGKYRRESAAAAGSTPAVPVWDLAKARVHPVCNTRFEFDLNRPGHLDKTRFWQHAGCVLHHQDGQ